MSDASVLERLSKFIDRESPHMSSFLYRMWGDQQQAITYHELRDAILDGGLSIDYLLEWQQDYSQYLSECYAPLARKAIEQATKDLLFEYGGELCDPVADAMNEYITKHGGKLIREISAKQYNAINTLVRQAAMTDTMTVDQLARAIRPCIGLTQYQSGMVKRFYEQLREQGVSHQKALKRQMVYAAKLHRERAALIAQTEMATTYNAATKKVVKDSIEQGLIGMDSERYWLDADDEKVCDKCGAIDGELVAMDEPFSNGIMDPPAHPGCRCGVGYKLTRPQKPLPSEPDPFASEWFEDGVVDYGTYEAESDYMWDNNFEPTNKEVRQMIDSVYEYTTANYTDILAAEADFGGRFSEYSTTMDASRRAAAKQKVDDINSYLRMARKYDGPTYRALGFDVGGDYDNGAWEEFRSAYQKGNLVQTDTMTSWTSKKSYMRDIIAARTGSDESAEYSVEVYMSMSNSRTGVNIRHLSELQAQDEVLFPKTQLRVDEYREAWIDDETLRVYIDVSEEVTDYGGNFGIGW